MSTWKCHRSVYVCVWRHICLQKLLWNIFQNKGYKDIHQETYYIHYIVKSLHHGPYVSFKSCLLLAYFTIWHMAWKTKCVQTLFTLEDRLPKNPWIHLILNWKTKQTTVTSQKTKVERRKKRSSQKKERPFFFQPQKEKKTNIKWRWIVSILFLCWCYPPPCTTTPTRYSIWQKNPLTS